MLIGEGMKYIGAHVSAAGGVYNAPINATNIGAKAFAFFTKNQKRWEAKPLKKDDISKFLKNLEKYGFDKEYILPHDSYLINLGNADSEKREKSYIAFVDEIRRCSQLGLKYLNIHPGSHLNQISEEESMNYIADNINKAIKCTENVIVVLENTAGQGSNIGYKFEHLAYIIKEIENKSRIGVCIDTCHAFAAGYDLRDKKSYDETVEKFDEIIGFEYLKAVHLNDAKSTLGSRVDRHHSIGKGNLGSEFFTIFMNDKRFDNIPIILETIDSQIWEQEIKYLYSLVK